MPFTVENFHDLVRLLEQRPQWRAELRRLVLSDELLELPALVRRLAEAQERTEQRVEELARAQARTEQAVAALVQAQASLTTRFDEHERRNALDFQPLKTDQLARRLAERPGMFRQLITEPQPLSPDEAETVLATLLSQGRLAPAQYQELLWADLLVRGWRDGDAGYLVVETSWTIGPKEIDRARRRAELLRRAGVPAWPVVVGYRVSEQAEARLQRQEVSSLLLPE